LVGSTLVGPTKIKCLEKARLFISVYTKSIHKHNTQFVLDELLFLACFGEFETSAMVAKFILGKDFSIDTLGADDVSIINTEGAGAANTTTSFVSSIHDQTINLRAFSKFLMNNTKVDVDEVQKSVNFKAMKHVIDAIAKGQDIWDGLEAGKLNSNHYLNSFAALPSTTIMVERAVKKAKLCKKTGEGERNVTAYGIAGDNINGLCSTQKVITTYPKRMTKLKDIWVQKAKKEGKKWKGQEIYEEDITRGPSLTRNIVNNAVKLFDEIQEMEKEI